ncbi:MAG: M24 family metallopeptidase C-terminal domain-containing protein, partial [Bauldia sp.]|nr:M24 family metallopeptidase C-terminal domain-containing protein [Bauldia sp.]
GMILSDEPGFYKTGAYGIRIENLVLVTPPAEIPDGERAMLGFETLSWCPIDRRLIDSDLLSPVEIAWVDAYHARLAPLLGRLLDDTEKEWLVAATLPLRTPSA